jgi:single stranded DNA-binding protein
MNNSVHLVGHVTADPVLTELKEGWKVAKFTLEVAPSNGRDKNPMWIRIEAWAQSADKVVEEVKKGMEVCVTGRLSISSYTKEIGGQSVTMSSTAIKLTGFFSCGSRVKSFKSAADTQAASRNEQIA